MKRRILSALLVLVLLLGVLAGCSKKKAQTTDDANKNDQSSETAETSSQYAYQAQFLDLPKDIQWIGSSCVAGDLLYFSASVPDGGKETYTDENGQEISYDTYSEAIFRMDLNSGECTKLENYVAEPVTEDPTAADGVTMGQDGSMIVYNSSTNISTMAAGTDGTIWLYRQTSRYSSDGSSDETISELIQLDAHGTLLRTITPVSDDASDNSDGWYYTISDIFSDDKGYVYTYDYQTLNVYGPDGTFICGKTGDELNGQVCQLSASEVGMTSVSADDKSVFRQLDPETKDWGRETPVSSDAWDLFPGNDVYAYFYTRNGSIYGERKDTGKTEKVVDWMSCDIDSSFIGSDSIAFLSDGRIAAVLSDYNRQDGSRQQQVVVLTRVDASSVKQKTELTLACFGLDYNLRSQIVKFNKNNSDYRIVVKDYSELATEDDYTAGLTKLNTEIISGNVPDLIMTNQLPVACWRICGAILTPIRNIRATRSCSSRSMRRRRTATSIRCRSTLAL